MLTKRHWIININSKIEYREYCSGIEIKSLLFDENYYWEILKIANDRVVSLQEITKKLEKKHGKIITKSVITTQIKEMKNEYILYANNDYSNIVSIIDIKLLLD